MSEMVKILDVSREEILRWLPAILDIYAQVHGLDAQARAAREEIMRRHFGRRGYRGLIALDRGRLVGFAYGYTGDPGQYWYDKVWAAMTPQQRAQWLEPEHFEFVELAVHPQWQGQGIGGRLHDLLLEGRPELVALLTVRADNAPALHLYRSRGWEVVLDDFHFAPGGEQYLVMGKWLADAERGGFWQGSWAAFGEMAGG